MMRWLTGASMAVLLISLAKTCCGLGTLNSYDILRRVAAGDPSIPVPHEEQCLPLAADGQMIIKSTAILSPKTNEMVPIVFQSVSAAYVENFAEVTSRQSEFTLCTQLYQLLDSHSGESELPDEILLEENCGLDIFGTTVFRGHEGHMRLVSMVMHTPPDTDQPTLICRSQVDMECCLNTTSTQNQWLTDESIEQNLVEHAIDFLSATYPPVVESTSMAPLTSPLALDHIHSTDGTQSIQVIIGIKSFALNVETRAAIRSTWMQFAEDSRPPHSAYPRVDFFPYFIIGNSSLVNDWQNHSIKEITLKEAIRREVAAHRDLLLSDELEGVQDSYYELPQKVLKFFKWTQLGNDSIPKNRKTSVYVIVCDDDAYLNLQELRVLIESLEDERQHADEAWGVYAGEVLEERLNYKVKAIRDGMHPHYLSEEDFGWKELPPFALGNFYLLSSRPAEYLARNEQFLRPIGNLEDLSVGFWLLSLNMKPRHLPGVCELLRCLGDITSFDWPRFRQPVNRFFAAADLSGAESFGFLHSAMLTKGYAEYNESIVLFDGAARIPVFETSEMLARYYRHILFNLKELNAMQSSKKNAPRESSGIKGLKRFEHNAVKRSEQQLIGGFQHLGSLDGQLSAALWRDIATHPMRYTRSVPYRLCIVLEDATNQSNDALNEQHLLLLQQLQQLSHWARDSQLMDIDIEIALQFPSAQEAILVTIVANLWPMRYFADFSLSIKDDRNSPSFLLSRAAAARYLSSFDSIVLSSSIGLYQGDVAAQQAIAASYRELWAIQSSIWAINQVEAPTTYVIGDVGNVGVVSQLPVKWKIASIEQVAENVQSVSLQEKRTTERVRQLSNEILDNVTASFSYFAIVVTVQSLYALPLTMRVIRSALPSYALQLRQHVYVLTEDRGDGPTYDDYRYRLHRLTKQVSEIEMELEHIDSVDKANSLLQKEIIFLTSYLDCETSALCLERKYSGLVHTLSNLAAASGNAVPNIRGVWMNGEALNSPLSRIISDFLSLSWMRMLWLPQRVVDRQSIAHRVGSLTVFTVPAFATMFAPKDNSLDATQLLRGTEIYEEAYPEHSRNESQRSGAVGYLYFRCDRADREALFAALRSELGKQSVIALGRCPFKDMTHIQEQSVDFHRSRFATDFHSQAVEQYRNFSFVIAAENVVQRDYITEKIVSAYLAGSIPIYHGAQNIDSYFDAHSMVDCQLTDLDADIPRCVEQVKTLLLSHNHEVRTLRKAPIIAGSNDNQRIEQWLQWFSWHDAARDTAFAHTFVDAFRQALLR